MDNALRMSEICNILLGWSEICDRRGSKIVENCETYFMDSPKVLLSNQQQLTHAYTVKCSELLWQNKKSHVVLKFKMHSFLITRSLKRVHEQWHHKYHHIVLLYPNTWTVPNILYQSFKSRWLQTLASAITVGGLHIQNIQEKESN